MSSIIIPRSLWERAKAHLLQDKEEHFAFFLAGIANHQGRISFLVKDIIQIQDKDIDFSPLNHSQLKLEALLRVINAARLEGLAVVEAHSHPFSRDNVSFSSIDLEELEGFSSYMLEDIDGQPYGATVWGNTEAIDGLYWNQENDRPLPIEEVRIVGRNLTRIITTSGKKLRSEEQNSADSSERFGRQVLAFGKVGQKKIGKTKVAIAGGGGLASQVVIQLAYLGVRDFTLIDCDTVEESNLNRLVGAIEADIGKPKVQVLERMVRLIVGKKGVNVDALEADIRDTKALNAMRRADVIFGCVDNDGARLILNELAIAYFIPLIDGGVGIEVEDGTIIEAGGRVMVVHPDGPCLLCAGEINLAEVPNDLAPPEELEVKKRQGYVSGADIPSPSVVSLNGIIASIAVTEFLALVTGVRPVKECTFYDMLDQKRVVQKIVKTESNCYTCSLKGIGDKVDIERYSSGVPRDIPSTMTSKPHMKKNGWFSQKLAGIWNKISKYI